jgi:hypothetical protein
MFCQWFLQQRGRDPSFPAFVIFTGEAQFTRDGIQNFRNQHLWVDENTHSSFPSHNITNRSSQSASGPTSVVIIYSDRTYFQTGLYRAELRSSVGNNMPDFLADVPLIIRRELHSSHVSLGGRNYRNRNLRARWIGRDGSIAWPPRTPDLNPLNFYLWFFLKSLVYSSPVLMWKLSEIELWQVFRQYATC